MKYSYCLGGDPWLKKLYIGASVVAGAMTMKDGTFKGEAIPATTTSATDGFGVSLDAGTYAVATPVLCQIVCNPMSVFRARVSGSATTGTALSAASKHVLTQTSASTTVITAADASGNEFAGGTAIALTGNNAGIRRPITSTVASTSVTVTLQFPYSVAVGDKVLGVPYSIGSHKVQLTTDFTEADGLIALGTGIDVGVVSLELNSPINSTNPILWVDFLLHDHIYNPID